MGEFEGQQGLDVADDSLSLGAPSGMALVVAIAEGESDPELMRALRASLCQWLDANRAIGGSLSLDAALGIRPGDLEAHRRSERDVALRRAIRALRLTDPDATASELRTQWLRFLGSPTYRTWRMHGAAPAGASALYQSLYCASQANRSEALTERQLRTIVRGNGGVFSLPQGGDNMKSTITSDLD